MKKKSLAIVVVIVVTVSAIFAGCAQPAPTPWLKYLIPSH